ncbi:hypothetical protein VTK73DRAFT_6428 [Phialemonium thermophilum]|uniref:Uncharacterized protein n=1 Tax=Phialemonium thermophilum TaxID=223376 RepID=A0ABR3V0W3_9PEZI
MKLLYAKVYHRGVTHPEERRHRPGHIRQLHPRPERAPQHVRPPRIDLGPRHHALHLLRPHHQLQPRGAARGALSAVPSRDATAATAHREHVGDVEHLTGRPPRSLLGEVELLPYPVRVPREDVAAVVFAVATVCWQRGEVRLEEIREHLRRVVDVGQVAALAVGCGGCRAGDEGGGESEEEAAGGSDGTGGAVGGCIGQGMLKL